MNFRPLLVLAVVFSALLAHATNTPAFVEAVTFNVEADGDKRVITVLSTPRLVRIDVPTDRMSILYDPQAEHYTGLEHSNYTWWEFSWPAVRDAVQGTARYATRLRDIGPALLEENSTSSRSATTAAPSDTNAPAPDSTAPPATTTAGDDGSGYVWHPTNDKKQIAGYDCIRWTGETVAGETIEAWCTSGVPAPIDHAVAILRAVNEPMALVPVRNLVPPTAFVAWDALTKGGVTPILMTWGADEEKTRIALVGVKPRDFKPNYFEVPKLYVKTTLVTMDGIGGQKPPGTRSNPAPLPPQRLPSADLPAP